jgi:biotin carboxyl carrier protein
VEKDQGVKRYRITVDGRIYDVEIDDPRARPVTARVLGEVFKVDVDGGVSPGRDTEGRSDAPASPAAIIREAPAGEKTLTAPIPGTVTELFAAVGQSVERGDKLLTIEAMKMFNVIRSPWAGTITAVHVLAGKHVNQGELLMSVTAS